MRGFLIALEEEEVLVSDLEDKLDRGEAEPNELGFATVSSSDSSKLSSSSSSNSWSAVVCSVSVSSPPPPGEISSSFEFSSTTLAFLAFLAFGLIGLSVATAV